MYMITNSVTCEKVEHFLPTFYAEDWENSPLAEKQERENVTVKVCQVTVNVYM